ncbi:MAG: hypothetical protein ACREEM_34345, partial [Blastocatellia bacterium]
YEGTRETRSAVSLNTAPNEAWLRGDFRNLRGAGADRIPGNADDTNRVLFIDPVTRAKREFPTPNVIPESMFHPVSKQMLKFIPASNVPGTLDSYNASGVNNVNRNQYLLKLDQRLSQQNNLFVRWARQTSDNFDPFPSARNFYPGFGRDVANRYDSIALSDTHGFTPATINEVRLGFYEQRNQNLGQNRTQDWNAVFGIPGLTSEPALIGWPAIRIDSYSEFGDRPNDPFVYTTKNLQLFDVLTMVRGSHNLRAGADIIRSTYLEADVRNVRGDFRFRGRASPNFSTTSRPSRPPEGNSARQLVCGHLRRSWNTHRGAARWRGRQTTSGNDTSSDTRRQRAFVAMFLSCHDGAPTSSRRGP